LTPFFNLLRFVHNTLQLLDNFINKIETQFEESRGKSIKFFIDLIDKTKASVLGPLDIVLRRPGYFYLIYYSSKLYKEKRLPWYDQTPVILVLQVDGKGFLGINFHYILPQYRAELIKKIVHHYPDKFFNDEQILPMSWRTINTIAGGLRKHLKFAVKRYLWSHMLRARGLRAVRIKNPDIIYAISYVSPTWVSITERQIRKEIKHRLTGGTGFLHPGQLRG